MRVPRAPTSVPVRECVRMPRVSSSSLRAAASPFLLCPSLPYSPSFFFFLPSLLNHPSGTKCQDHSPLPEAPRGYSFLPLLAGRWSPEPSGRWLVREGGAGWPLPLMSPFLPLIPRPRVGIVQRLHLSPHYV